MITTEKYGGHEYWALEKDQRKDLDSCINNLLSRTRW